MALLQSKETHKKWKDKKMEIAWAIGTNDLHLKGTRERNNNGW